MATHRLQTARLQTAPASGTGKLVRSLKKAFMRAWKALMRRLTGRSEISRILSRHEGYSSDLVQAIARSIARSSDKDAVFCKLFDVPVISAQLADKKAVSDEDQPRLVWCLEIFNIVNRVIEKAGVLQRTPFDTGSPEQVAELERLWSSLQPSIRREAGGWGDIGFQNGERPETDFRGMGLLGLVQLLFFSESRNAEARQILADSTNPKRYFPFAAAGINVTAFTKTMLEQRRLDTCLYDAIVKHAITGTPPEDKDINSQRNELVAAGFAAFNAIYGDEYVEFSRFWHASNPENSTMAFPGIFGTIKERSNARFSRLVEQD